ncbi:MAG: ATP-grasp fold amidoligase family protein [Nitrososphaerales archaeon]
MPVLYKAFPESKNIERYRYFTGRTPNLISPRTLTERVLRKMLFDRDPRLTVTSDKLLARDFVRTRLGDDQSLTRLYGVVRSPAEMKDLSLPDRFVMKPSHASGMVKIVADSASLPKGELEKLAASWLRLNYFDSYQEWAYKDIRPHVLFEELLDSGQGIPDDYKMFCFGGEPRFFHLDKDRFGDHRRNYYTMDLRRLPVRDSRYENFQAELDVPSNFDRMVEMARRLAAGTDFVRVDLYNVKGRIVFGELTSYPGNALFKFEPPEWDLKFGGFWK